MSKDIIGLKQADGSFYPILKRGTPSKKRLQVTTSKDNQTTVQINLYCASDDSFADAEFLDTLKIDGLVPHEKKNHQIDLILSLDENDNLSADLNDKESGKTAQKPVNFAPITKQTPKDISSELVAFDEQNPEKGDFDPLSAVAQTAAAAGVAFGGMPNTDYATGFANDPLFGNESKLEDSSIDETEETDNLEISEDIEDDFAEESTDSFEEISVPVAEDSALSAANAEPAESETIESAANDLLETADLPDFPDDFTTEQSEDDAAATDDLPDFEETFITQEDIDDSAEAALPETDGLTTENEVAGTDELPDFGGDFATESAESETSESAEPSDGLFTGEVSEETENTENSSAPADDLFAGDALSSFSDLPDFADEVSAETEETDNLEISEDIEDDFAEESTDPFEEISVPVAEDSDLSAANAEPAEGETIKSAANDLLETADLPDFTDDFGTENDAESTDDLPDFGDDFAAEPAEGSASESAEPGDDLFAGEVSEETENTENASAPTDDLFAGDDLSGFGDLPDFADDEATDPFAEETAAENAENTGNEDSYFDEAAAVAAMASAGALGFAENDAAETNETSGEDLIKDGDEDDFSLDDFSDLDAGFELPNEETLAELDKEIDEINMNFSSQTALSAADSFVDDFADDSTYDDLADSYSNSYAAENGITNFDFLDDKANRPKLPLVPLVCVLCAVISIASCFVIWLMFLNNKNAPAPVVAETAVTKEYQGVSVIKEDPAKPEDTENTESKLEKALAQENSIIIIDAPIVIPIPVMPVVSQEETKRYQIKRGDTLWDIADSFYKDPWMYEKIAKANKIKNPDYILSGTWIEIPPM